MIGNIMNTLVGFQICTVLAWEPICVPHLQPIRIDIEI